MDKKSIAVMFLCFALVLCCCEEEKIGSDLKNPAANPVEVSQTFAQALALYEKAFAEPTEAREVTLDKAVKAFEACRKNTGIPKRSKACALLFEADALKHLEKREPALEKLDELIKNYTSEVDLVEKARTDRIYVMLELDSPAADIVAQAKAYFADFGVNESNARFLIEVCTKIQDNWEKLDLIKAAVKNTKLDTTSPDASPVWAELQKTLDSAVGGVRSDSMIKEWRYLGPFRENWYNKRQFDKPMDLDKLTDIDFGKSCMGHNWNDQKRNVVSQAGNVALNVQLGSQGNCSAYAATWVHSPDARKIKIFIGSDDAAKVFVNGVKKFEIYTNRGAAADQNSFEAELTKGWNLVIIKIYNGVGPYGFFLRIADPNGVPFKDIKYSINK